MSLGILNKGFFSFSFFFSFYTAQQKAERWQSLSWPQFCEQADQPPRWGMSIVCPLHTQQTQNYKVPEKRKDSFHHPLPKKGASRRPVQILSTRDRETEQLSRCPETHGLLIRGKHAGFPQRMGKEGPPSPDSRGCHVQPAVFQNVQPLGCLIGGVLDY